MRKNREIAKETLEKVHHYGNTSLLAHFRGIQSAVSAIFDVEEAHHRQTHRIAKPSQCRHTKLFSPIDTVAQIRKAHMTEMALGFKSATVANVLLAVAALLLFGTSSATLSDYAFSTNTSNYIVIQNLFNSTLISRNAFDKLEEIPYYLPPSDGYQEKEQFHFDLAFCNRIDNGFECELHFPPHVALPNVTVRAHLLEQPLRKSFTIHRAGRPFVVEAHATHDNTTTVLIANVTHLPIAQNDTWDAAQEYFEIRFSLLEVLKKLKPQLALELPSATLERLRIEMKLAFVNVWRADYDEEYAKTGTDNSNYIRAETELTLLYADQFDGACECNRNATQPISKQKLGTYVNDFRVSRSVGKPLSDYVRDGLGYVQMWVEDILRDGRFEVETWIEEQMADMRKQQERRG